MKKVIAFCLSAVVLPYVSFSQLNGKVVTLSSTEACTSKLHFTSDSVAYCITECDDNELITKLTYTVNEFGFVSWKKIPDSLYNPIIGLMKKQINVLNTDSTAALCELIFYDKGTAITRSNWLFWSASSSAKGMELNLIPQSFFADSSAMIWFTDLYKLNRNTPKFRSADFIGEGSRYIVQVDLPPTFGNGKQMIYDSDFFDLSELKFRVINGMLHTWNTPEWIPVSYTK